VGKAGTEEGHFGDPPFSEREKSLKTVRKGGSSKRLDTGHSNLSSIRKPLGEAQSEGKASR